MAGRKRRNTSRTTGRARKVQMQGHSPQNNPGPSTTPPTPQKPDPLIPLDLIRGAHPTIKPNFTRTGFDYVPIIKGPGDRDNKFDVIRVIVIHPGQPEDPIKCSIKIRVLPLLDAVGARKEVTIPGIDDAEIPTDEYVALSYAWEGQEPSAEIQIWDTVSNVLLPFKITPNLRDALLELRDRAAPQIFWADAISMDQNDPVEKSQQLTLLSRIYREATKVCIWLGSEESGVIHQESEHKTNIKVADAFRLMTTIRDWRTFRWVVEKSTSCDQWSAFMWLLNRSWFERRWVVQEVVLARRAELRCGTRIIGWKEFAEAVSFFELMEDRVKDKFRGDQKSDHVHDKFGKFREYSACRLVRVADSVVSRRQEGRVLQRLESLESLISILAPFETGDPKDIVYSILSLANDVKTTTADVKPFKKLEMSDLGSNLRHRKEAQSLLFVLNRILPKLRGNEFHVDYAKSFDEICLDLYSFAIHHSRSLDLILRPWCPTDSNGQVRGCTRKLPSWVRSSKEYAWKLNKIGDVERANADLLVGLPGKSPYQASGSTRVQYNFERASNSNEDHILSVEGFHLDTLLDVEERAIAGTLSHTWLKHKSYEGSHMDPTLSPTLQKTRSKVSELFWRTLMAGKGHDGESPPPAYSLLSQSVFDTDDDCNLLQDSKDTQNPVYKQFLDRVLAVIWGRRLALTSRLRYLALIPGHAKPYDMISILYGCSVPVVLRDTGEKTEEGKTKWELIGECYIHDMMMGEALVVRQKQGLKDKFYNPQSLKIR